MKVTLRKRKMKSGNISLYLEYYRDGKREYEYLKMFLIPGDTKGNKETLMLAETIKTKREGEILNKTFGFVRDIKGADFLEYFQHLIDKRGGTNKDNWASALNYLKDFTKGKLMFKQITEAWLNKFKDYLDNTKKLGRVGKLSQNSKQSYFNKVKAALKIAYHEKMISEDPSKRTKGFKYSETSREYLTLEEVKLLLNTECSNKILKDAFIFSCVTGLRWSDINIMKWKDLIETPTGTVYQFRQTKTKGVEYLPLSAQSLKYLPERTNPNDRVWSGLRYSAWNNAVLLNWVGKAGIYRHITFHCARHTFATLQLTHGTDIYTVSKLLGHRELKTTQVYAKVIDQKKTDAVNIIPDLDI